MSRAVSDTLADAWTANVIAQWLLIDDSGDMAVKNHRGGAQTPPRGFYPAVLVLREVSAGEVDDVEGSLSDHRRQ